MTAQDSFHVAVSKTRSSPKLDSAARVVMCSALGQEKLVMEALQAGAKDFIVKPFKPDSVLTTVKKVLEKD